MLRISFTRKECDDESFLLSLSEYGAGSEVGVADRDGVTTEGATSSLLSVDTAGGDGAGEPRVSPSSSLEELPIPVTKSDSSSPQPR